MRQPKSGTPARTHRLRLNITTVVFVSLGALDFLAIAKFGWEASQSWQDYSRAQEQRESSAAADLFIKGTYEILLERLATDNALQAPGAADAAVTTEIEAHRKVIRETYEPALAMIARRSFANKDALLADLKDKIRRANDARRQADSEIKRARDARNEALRKTFAPTMTDMVNASLSLWYAAVYSAAKGNAALTQLAVIK